MDNENETLETTTSEVDVSENITLTQDELNAKLQSESDKRVQQALKTAREKFEAEYNAKLETEKQEAAKLAKLSTEERERAKFQKEKELFEKDKVEMQRMKLESETFKQLSTEQLPTEFSKYVVGVDAESTLNNINEFKDLWQKAIEQAIESRLAKTKIPGSSTKVNSTMTKEQFGQLSYKDRVELLNTNPELYNQLNN